MSTLPIPLPELQANRLLEPFLAPELSSKYGSPQAVTGRFEDRNQPPEGETFRRVKAIGIQAKSISLQFRRLFQAELPKVVHDLG